MYAPFLGQANLCCRRYGAPHPLAESRTMLRLRYAGPRGTAASVRRLIVAVTAAATALALAACATAGAGSTSQTGTARTITHELGETAITGTPGRVVALEFSFVQALDALGVQPVGIADDDDADRIRQLLGAPIEYTSVGTRLEPNLELVSSLSPDLIIADLTRHTAIVPQLKQIAPTIVLNSWEGSYQDIKDAVVTIADALDDRTKGEQVVAQHEARIKELAARIPDGEDRRFLLAVATPDAMSLHTSAAFSGSVFQALGLSAAVTADDAVESGVGIERLLDVDPDVLFVATDGPGTVFEQWQKNSAWSSMSAVAKGSVFNVDRNQYARFRGLQTAETIAADIVQNVVGER
ncbi:ABC transporter substrate-binding protein [Micromonospora sp. WMMD1082]|uniref:ABC transporter substrate-binding protein n=1 Tax=Micromonospora sp. WMMD1082 TaxID=3016104 RepID=UPI002415F6FC|nr:ABC transporter substrate-binding protein [Micromonospora sp. WMMD1082]MDG4797079.1 ABC transporter substrate-binding protein [Micromonospora sp. WMMD1082]